LKATHEPENPESQTASIARSPEELCSESPKFRGVADGKEVSAEPTLTAAQLTARVQGESAEMTG
jgi:hypothetical protein